VTPIGNEIKPVTAASLASATQHLLQKLYSYPTRDEIIRQRYLAGESGTDLAREYGLSAARISQIIHRPRKA
jgi:DNA-directed RNA polymerase sigma subunit (sigma70/sigma32)